MSEDSYPPSASSHALIQTPLTAILSRCRWLRVAGRGTLAAMEGDARTKVFIAEDSAEVRRYIVDLVEEVEGARVVGEAESADAAVDGIMRTEPDCVVLDFQLVGGTGLDVLRAVHPRAPQITFIVLTNFANPQYKKACVAAGAHCFFDKSNEFMRVRDVIAGLEPQPN